VQLLADLTPLRTSPDFRRLWAGLTLSAAGSAMTAFAIPLQVCDITRSPAAVGLIGLAGLVPLLAIGLLGGALLDAVDKRKLILASTGAGMALSAVLTAQAWLGLDWVWLLYVLVAAQSAAVAVNVPARKALTPALLPAGQLTAGLALQRLTSQVTLIAGPALAGIITAAPHLGAARLLSH
jgi:MFS family permease